MKNLFFTACVLFITGIATAQTDYNVPLKTAADCKAAEPAVLAAANLALSKPMDDIAGHKAQMFVWAWAQNSEHTITIAGPISKLWSGKTNTNIIWLFAACQAKYILEHPEKEKESDTVLLESYKLLADYISKTENGVTITKNVQKLLDAKKNGTMEAYVKGK